MFSLLVGMGGTLKLKALGLFFHRSTSPTCVASGYVSYRNYGQSTSYLNFDYCAILNSAGVALPPGWAPLLSAMENNGIVSAEWFYRLSCVGTSKETGGKL